MFDYKTRILIVDDMMTMRKLIRKACSAIGFHDIAEASDGVQGWELVAQSLPPFGLIISDWAMPNCTGIDFLKRIRSDGRFGKTPFILLTTELESKSNQVLEAIKAGASQHVVKPFTEEQLRTAIERASRI